MSDDGVGRAPMSRERWARLEPLIDALLDLPPADRVAYCDRVAATDESLGNELRRLLGRLDGTGDLLDDAAAERSALLANGAEVLGERSLFAALQASIGTDYRLARELGGGGMSRVFVADEPRLARQVAIKVLSPELAAGINADRFAREIKLAASLQQANIVPVLSAGMAGGLPYYTMPFVDGRSLRDRLTRDGALPVGDGISVLRDVARALAYAHARGVVHRDIKPGNVLLSGGTAMVTDFGIAKAIAAAADGRERTGEGDAMAVGDASIADLTLTQTGTSLGTPAYIAPEQASGAPTDHRADVYSFGCMAYEIFAGRPPFQGATVQDVIAAHLRDTPGLLAAARADLPPAIAALITRCLEKNPAARPQTAGEILRVLDGDAAVARPEPTRPRTRRRLVGALAGLAIAALGVAALYRTRRPPEPITIAAVPFTNRTQNPALEYRSDGLSDEILTGLARVPGVEIVSRIAAARFKQRDPRVAGPDIGAVARALGTRFVVTGTVSESRGRLVVSVQLNDSAARNELWASTFDRDSLALGSIADDVVRTLADTLRAHFGTRVGMLPGSVTGTTNAEALDAFLAGQAALKKRGAGVTEAVAKFEHAIALDPKFGRAYAALAMAQQLIPYFVGTPPADVRDRTFVAAREALSLDPTLAEAHLALGSAYAVAGEWTKFDDEFRQAIALEPDNVTVRQTYARLLITPTGRIDEGLAQLQRARQLEPTSAMNDAWLSYAHFLKGDVDQAITESATALTLDPLLLPAVNLGSLMNLAQGRDSAALRIVKGAVPPASTMTNAPYVYAMVGDTARANALTRAMEANSPRPWFMYAGKASVRLALGDADGALALLEQSDSASGPAWTLYIPIGDRAYDLVRHDNRFVRLIRRANLDPRSFERMTPRR